MISVKCPACGLVDWNVGNCKRCETPLVGLDAEGGGGHGYFHGAFEEDEAAARTVQTARRVVAVCAVVVLGLTALGGLYLARRPTGKQWFWSFYRHDPTVAEIFRHNLEVSGGAERVKALRSFKGEGRLNFNGGEAARVATSAGGEVTFVMHVKMPDKSEMEIEMGQPKRSNSPFDEARAPLSDYFTPAAPKVTVSLRRGFDGARGWEYVERTILTPGSTVPIKQHSSRELEGDELERIKHSSRSNGLVRLDDEYTSLRLDGRERVTWGTQNASIHDEVVDDELRGHEAYVVSGVNKEGKNETLYFDTETGLLLRVDYEEEDDEDETVKVACSFGDYREVGGLTLPHRIHFRRDEESMTLTMENYLLNEPVPDSTFEMPE